MVVGTDGGSFPGPGLTLKQEFRELSDAGISPLQILQMATVNAAQYLHKSETMGTVEIGKDADMVLLDADPLTRVEHLHDIARVVRAGPYFSRQTLDGMKAEIRKTWGTLN